MTLGCPPSLFNRNDDTMKIDGFERSELTLSVDNCDLCALIAAATKFARLASVIFHYIHGKNKACTI